MFDFVVIGFQKCGTDSARQWLLKHPGAVVPKGEVGVGVVSPPFGTLGRTKEDFIRQLCDQPGAPDGVRQAGTLRGVVDPTYALCDVEANAAALTQLAPKAKIITFERPRIDRAYSAWAMASEAGWEDRSFEAAIASCVEGGPSWTDEGWLRQSYVEAGEYNRIVATFERHFDVHRLQMGDGAGLAEVLGISGPRRWLPFPHDHQGRYPALEAPDPKVWALLENYYLERGEV